MIDLAAVPSVRADVAEKHLAVLGFPRVVVGGREVVLHGAQPQKLLVRLVLDRGQPVAVGDLAEALWPRERAPHWQGALRGVVTKVRGFLSELGEAEVGVASLGQSYRFESAGTATVDAWEADAALARSVELARLGDVGGAADAAERAATLLRGSLLPGVDGEWADRRRAELERLRCRALRQASSAASSCGRHDDAVSFASEAVAEDDLDEESHRLLMLAFAAAGNRALAIRAYDRCRQTLADELGVLPSSATQSIYEQILRSSP